MARKSSDPEPRSRRAPARSTRRTPARRTTRPAPPEEPTPIVGSAKAEDEPLTGVPTYTLEYLLDHPDRATELAQAPEGTPGRELAQRTLTASSIIAEAVRETRQWKRLHGKAESLTRSIAERMVELRTLFQDENGRPDLRGLTYDYKVAARAVYERAGVQSGRHSSIQSAIRYHVSRIVRERLREMAEGDEERYQELCTYYRLNPHALVETQRQRRQSRAALPELRVAEDDAAGLLRGATEYASKALSLPSDIDPDELEEDVRESIVEELERIQTLAAELLDRLAE